VASGRGGEARRAGGAGGDAGGGRRRPREMQIALIRATPSSPAARDGARLGEGASGAGLDKCSGEEFEALQRLNPPTTPASAFPSSLR